MDIKLNLGCYNKPLPGFINIDVRPPPDTKADVVDDVFTLQKFENNYADLIYCSHTLEHAERNRIPQILKRWYDVLKPNGLLRLAVPNMAECMKHYMYFENLEVLLTTLGGSQKHHYDYHLSHFDEKFLTKLLKETGFCDIRRWDWTKTEHWFCDDYSQSYLPEGTRTYKQGRVRVDGGRHFSLNLEAQKPK